MKILIVGCGGTGSNLIKELGRYMQKSLYDAEIILIDGDVVEEKNLERQAFCDMDVSSNKAEAMSEAVSDVFDVEFTYYKDYITEIKQLEDIVEDEKEVMIIGCVDNHHCRRILHEFFLSREKIIYIDAANEFSVGEVVVGIRVGGFTLFSDRAECFPEILDDSKSVVEMSCEELNRSNPQHIVTNLMAAVISLSLVIQAIEGNLHQGGIYYFDSLKCKIQRRENSCFQKK